MPQHESLDQMIHRLGGTVAPTPGLVSEDEDLDAMILRLGGKEDEPSLIKRALTPLVPEVTAPFRALATKIDAPSLTRSPMMARVRGFAAGAVQGAGDLVAEETSPAALAATVLTAGVGRQILKAPGRILKGVKLFRRGPALEGLETAAETAAKAPAPPTSAVRASVIQDAVADAGAPPISAPRSGAIPKGRQFTFPSLRKHSPEVRKMTEDVFNEQLGMGHERRYFQSVARTRALSSPLAAELAQTGRAGKKALATRITGAVGRGGTTTAQNEIELLARKDAMESLGQQVSPLAQKVTAGEATDIDKVRLTQLWAQFAGVEASFVAGAATAGRTLNIARQAARALRSNDEKLLQQLVRNPAFDGDVTKLAQGLAEAGADPVAQLRFLRSQKNSPGLRGFYYANILSGLKTQERNIIGNAFNSLSNIAVAPVAGVLRPGSASVREIGAQAKGTMIGLQRGMGEALFALKNGFTRANLTSFDVPRVEFRGGGANPFNLPGRGLDAMDAFFRSIAKHQELFGSAYTRALREGKRGTALERRMADLVTDEAFITRADRFATRAVFQEDPGAFAQGIIALKQKPGIARGMDFVIPFVKTPANIIRQGAEFSPAGFAMKAARQGGRAGAQAEARALMGSLALMPIGVMAATGALSGNGPTNRSEREALFDMGWKPNSIKIGDEWISYQLFQPLSVPMAAVANLAEAWRDQGDDGTLESAVTQMAFRTAGSVLNQSFLSGLSVIINAVNDPERWADRAKETLATGFIPLSGLSRNIAQQVDPVIRDVEGVVEAGKSVIPGLSKTLRPRLNRFGQPLIRTPGKIPFRPGPPSRLEVPLRSKVSTDPVVRELDRLGITPPRPSSQLQSGGQPLKLTRQEEFDLTEARGQASLQSLKTLMDHPNWATWTDDQRRQIIEAALGQRNQRRGVRAVRQRILRARRITQTGQTP